MKQTDETRQVGREIKKFLVSSRMSRAEFCSRTGLGASTVDKLMIGLYSEATLQIVIEKTKFTRSNSRAAEQLGAYYKETWSGYLTEFLFLRPSFVTDEAIIATRVAIDWDNDIPGLVMIDKDATKKLEAKKSGGKKQRSVFGVLSIPQERSPLLYINFGEPPWVGRHLILSIMLGEPVMRGAMMSVHNVIAQAYTPVVLPVSFRRLDYGPSVDAWGTIRKNRPAYESYRAELDTVVSRQFVRTIFLQSNQEDGGSPR